MQHIKTLAGLVDGRRARTSAGALLELSMLEMEKQRLTKEMERSERRCSEIRGRIAEIQAKQQRLQRFVDRPQGELAAAAPLPIHAEPSGRLKRRQLTY
ncbi:MAG: hypothetical protein ACT4NV_02660 [Rhodoferax sp.]